VRRWDLTSLSRDAGQPRVLFSEPEGRAVVIDLAAGQALGDHQVRERALLHVVSGTVRIEAADTAVECPAGTTITFEPGEAHSVQALADARLLLVLTPWPGAAHYADGALGSERLPANAMAEPLPDQ
jgi:quercetin dioxygenase-like cupin family protein